jgi:hypothetical protein
VIGPLLQFRQGMGLLNVWKYLFEINIFSQCISLSWLHCFKGSDTINV